MSKERKGPRGKKGIPGTTTYIRVVRLGKWFPAGDPLAAAIARLSILREDFMLELRGIYAKSITALDTHSDALGDSRSPDYNSNEFRIQANFAKKVSEGTGSAKTNLIEVEYCRIAYKRNSERDGRSCVA